MRSGSDFTGTVRQGIRVGRPTLVLHARIAPGESTVTNPPARVGFVVSKAVGNAVRRNAVKRRLRHSAALLSRGQDDGRQFVVRALPAAAEADYARLDADLGSAWRKARARLEPAGGPR